MMFTKPRQSARPWLATLYAAGLALVMGLGALAPGPAQAQGAASTPTAASPVANPTATRELPSIKPAGADANANPYGLRAVWAQGDFVAKTTLITLAIMSLLSWYVIVAKVRGKWTVNLNPAVVPRLRVNRSYADAVSGG